MHCRKEDFENFAGGFGNGAKEAPVVEKQSIIRAIYRYPVKGLSPEVLERIKLAPGETVPGDRLYAIENGPSGFDPSAPRRQPKTRYLMLIAQRTARDAANAA